MFAALVASFLLVVVGASVPALSRTYIDTFVFGGQDSLLGVLFAAMGAAAVLTAVLTALQQGNLLRARLISSTLSSARFLRHLLRLPVTFFAQRSPADLVQRLQSNDTVAETLARDLAAAGVDAVVVVGYALLLWTYDPQLTLVGVGIALLNVVAMRVVIRLRATGTQKLRADRARLTNTSYSGLQLIETMKATGGETGYFRRWAGQHATTLDVQQRLGVPSAALAVVAPTLATLNSALILLIGGTRAVEGAITAGLLVAFQALVTSFTAPLTRLNSVAGRIQDFAADVARLKDVETFPADPLYTRREPPASTRRLAGYVTLENVTFGYNPLDKPLLTGLSLAVGPGQQIALVGGSGSGKSTVSRLIAGLYTPWEGIIRIDGRMAGGPAARRAGRFRLLRRPGRVPVRGHGPGQRGAVGPLPERRRGRDGAAGRGAVRGRGAAPRWPPQPRRAGRPQLLGRTAAAAGDRPRAGAAAQHPRPGRGDQRPGRRDRGPHHRQPAAARLRLRGDRAPAEHRPGQRRDRGAGPRHRRGAGTARAAARRRGPYARLVKEH